jgi:hypothetical protein
VSRERAQRRKSRAAEQAAERERRARRRRRAARREATRRRVTSPARTTYQTVRPLGRAFRRRGKAGRVTILGLLAFVVIVWWWSGSWELGLAALAFAVLAAPVLLTVVGDRGR